MNMTSSARPLVTRLSILVVALGLCTPLLAHAASTTFFGPIISDACNCASVTANGITSSSAPAWGCILATFQNLIGFAVSFACIIITIFIALAGFTYMTSGGSAEKRQLANKRIMNAVIGLLIVLCAYLLVDSIMKVIYNPNAGSGTVKFGPWNSILGGQPGQDCLAPTAPPKALPGLSGASAASNASGGTAPPAQLSVVPGGGMCSAAAGKTAAAAAQYQNQVCADATADGIPGQCNQLLGILAQESGGNQTIQSGAGAIGLMQLEPDTAAQYGVTACSGSTRANPSAACVAALDNPQTNIAAGVEYYASLYNQNNGNVTLATAGYNGGQGANKASVTCPGETQWQCTANGGYAQTRNYVTSVSSLASTIGGNCT